jgi:hypothetical protein
MFNRSIKYLVLVIINIVVITILFMGDDQSSDIFDTDYVISLLDNNKQLERQVLDLSEHNKFLESSSEDIERQVMQTRALIDSNMEKLQQCKSDQAAAIALAEEQAAQRKKIANSQSYSAEVCSDNAVQVSFLTKQLASLKEQLTAANQATREANTETQMVQNQLEKLKVRIDNASEEKATYQETIQQLEKDLKTPIYVKQIYITPTYCQPPRFSELVCVQRLLVRPQFSKKPVTDVQTTLTNPKGKVIGKFSFDASKAKLVNFPFPENAEQPAGEYTVTFAVNNQTLTEKVVLKH